MDSEIEKLSVILSKLQNLYYKKKDQLEELQLEISELKDILNHLGSIVSKKSFQSADQIYSKLADSNLDKSLIEDYFTEDISKEKVKGTNLKRKLFSGDQEEEEELLCILNLTDLDELDIKFITPELTNIKETSEDFLTHFIKEGLLEIKKKNPELEVQYNYYKNTDIIESIKVINLNSIDDYDLITLRIRSLLKILPKN